jgi:hypothetical protein
LTLLAITFRPSRFASNLPGSSGCRCGRLKPGDEIAASFTLIFADTDPVAGREVVKALHDLAELTTSILETFEAHCEGSDDKIAKLASVKSGPAGDGKVLLIGSTKPASGR